MKGVLMLKTIKRSSILLCALCLTFSATLASEGRGQRMFDQNLKKACGINGFEVARKHTQTEWTAIYENQKLNDEMKIYCPEAKDFKSDYVRDVYEFMYAAAKDSGKVLGA